MSASRLAIRRKASDRGTGYNPKGYAAIPGWIAGAGWDSHTSGAGPPSPNLTIPLLISLLAVIVTAHLAGRAPALFATAANFLVDWYFFAQPRLSFALPNGAGCLASGGLRCGRDSH